MTQVKPNIGMNRSKDHKLYRESAKERYGQEKKELGAELHDNKLTIEKLFNDKFEYYDEVIEHSSHHVVFKKSQADSFKEVVFNFEENYNHLKSMWHIEN